MSKPMSEHTVVIERELDAPRERVWEAWTDPDEVTRWWGPAGFASPRERIEMDVRPGGVFRLTMVGPDGAEYPSAGHFVEVEPPARLAWAEPQIECSPLMRAVATTVELVALEGGRTRVVVTSRMTCTEELPEMARAGWGQQLDRLAGHVRG